MKQARWIIGYTLSALLAVALAGTFGIIRSASFTMALLPEALAAAVVPGPVPSYDSAKPTVAVLLGNTPTEATDFLVPYAMFVESGAYNVYAVAESRAVRTLAGGVDVVPQVSFAELTAKLHGSPNIIVVPAMLNVGSPDNVPVLDWLRQHDHGQTLVFSWCAGAEVLAASGLIDGKTATTHWGKIDAFERTYPAVTWQRGERYVDSGMLLTTGGITAGVDATLHLLQRRNGQAVADRVAQAMHYPGSPYVTNPRMPHYTTDLADTIVLAHNAFNWPRRQTGVWLYDGVGEVDLAAVVEAYQVSATNQIHTVATAPALVSQHGLQIVPRRQAHNLLSMDRVLIPGGDGAKQAADHLPDGLGGAGREVTLLQNDQTPTYAFTLALQDLASTHNVLTARVAAKYLEVRSPLRLVGPRWPLHLLVIPVLAGLGGCIALWSLLWLSHRVLGLHRGNRRRPSAPSAQPWIGSI
jgi:transcriptional regulator GlxA family with amidase domain